MKFFDNKKSKLPTLLGILLLVVGAGVGVVLVQNNTGFIPRATPEFAPKDLTVTNITENSFTISWVTEQKTLGFLKFGETTADLATIASDDRDALTGVKGDYLTHHVTVRGLRPEATHFFKVASGGEGQFYDNGGQPYQVTTASVLSAPPPADTAYGEVVTSTATPAEDSLVYVSLPGGARISTLVRDGGQWALSLSTTRVKNLQTYLTYDPLTTKYDILVKSGNSLQSSVVALTGADQPLPTITLGEDYDFSTQQESVEPKSDEENEILDEAATQSAEARTESGFNLEPLGEVTEATEELTILNPAIDKESVNATKPEFHGTAPAGTILKIEVHSENNIQDTVTVDDNNTWSWSPPENLEPGEHTVTVSYTDEGGILQTMTRTFTVYAAETNDEPAFVSTPSATPKATPKPTPKTTPTPPPRVTQPSSGSGIPKSGSVENTLLMLTTGLAMMIIGVFAYKSSLLGDDES